MQKNYAKSSKHVTGSKAVQKLDRYREPGVLGSGGVDLTLKRAGREAYEQNVKSILEKYRAIGKESGLSSKLVLVGDSAVGKTCLMTRYCDNVYDETWSQATVGVDFSWQRFLKNDVGFTLHLWDTAGQERFRAMTQSYYRDANACIAAFNLNDKQASSLEHCEHWVNEVRSENLEADRKGDFCVFLVGCKADEAKNVGRDVAEKMARKLNAEYFEVSAKTGFSNGANGRYNYSVLLYLDINEK
mmetsp:Transcript_28318/g.39123  ORF Transcript_28318/g.39123 Transcript_28318/m.39123 type:complete len:244 (+) Transcript_28318:199-930(+)|eukprot:CAMPEP_0196572722 /NCGR_PEP_ID=MMETSP1081-20130531/2716_1 /TAXON_ID=36882 /ORGANISM="Pyramimonas amylifera, Strain CCMP720" /LENGTH=243 /DNA_ID=CAMNT_0041890135 /DNA_START=199 /DNA_END=930 /DNA_ORIENTATION=-